jgi:sulfite oxidase
MEQAKQSDAGFDPGRRDFVRHVGQAGMLSVLGGPLLSSTVFAQAAQPAAPSAPAAPPPVPGTVPNATVMAQKDAVVKVLTEMPLTASTVAEHYHDAVTPTSRMFIRNNLLTPEVDAATHKLSIAGLVDKPLELELGELKRMRPVTVQAMLECAGAGRTGYQPVPRGTPWPAAGGFGCPRWTGVRLGDLLKSAGVKPEAVHVAFFGADFSAVATAPPVVRSIPMSKAMEPNTLIVWEINGEPLPPIHGYPLRALVPGWAGSASIKWLKRIEVLDAPFKGTYMDDSYRMPRHPVAPGEKMPTETVVTEAWPVKSIITSPASSAKVRQGQTVVIEGKAWAGDNAITKVEISTDEGLTWQNARLARQGDKYAWRQFSYNWKAARPGFTTFLARATDSKGNAQPMVATWNPLGYYWNGIHRIGVVVEPA